jgi:hypothetical protein
MNKQAIGIPNIALKGLKGTALWNEIGRNANPAIINKVLSFAERMKNVPKASSKEIMNFSQMPREIIEGYVHKHAPLPGKGPLHAYTMTENIMQLSKIGSVKEADLKTKALAGLLGASTMFGRIDKEVMPTLEKTFPKIIHIKAPKHLEQYTGHYETQALKSVADSSKARGWDPELHVAQAIAEGAKHDPVNILQSQKHTKNLGTNIHIAFEHYQDLKNRYPHANTIELMQRYNGMGKLKTKQYISSYGPYLGKHFKNRNIDMGKYKPYGKKVVDIKDSVVHTSPELQSLIHQ